MEKPHIVIILDDGIVVSVMARNVNTDNVEVIDITDGIEDITKDEDRAKSLINNPQYTEIY